MPRALIPSLLAALVAAACADVATPPTSAPVRAPDFIVVPLWPDTVGICIGAGSPTGTYTFSWIIQNGQPGDIHDATSPTTATLGPGECLLPWRRAAPLPGGVFVTVIVTEVATPSGVGLDSVELQDRFGTRTSSSATDTVQVDTLKGGALTYYHHVLGQFSAGPLLVSMDPLPDPDPSLASGRMRVLVDLLPPDPCGPIPAPAESAVAICGTIHNPGDETFTNGVLMVGGASMEFGAGALPPGPCRQYVVQGSVAVPAGLVTQLLENPAGLTLRFDSREHPGGAIGGSSAAASAPATQGAAASAPGAADIQGEACLIRFGP